jgi:PAS domain S-box-containing protein
VEAPPLFRTNYAIRTGAFAYCFLVLGLHVLERGASPVILGLFALQFLAYPHLLYWRAMRSERPSQAELDNLFVDATLLGVWTAYLGFPTWITYPLLAGTMLNATVNRGLQGTFTSLGCSAAGAALYLAIGKFTYSPVTSDLVSTLCFFGVLAYTCAVGYVVYRQNRRIVRGRDQLRSSEERYRLIAENVADLIGMVDHNGRWLYASAAYSRVLLPEDLEVGADAFRRLHPDDADRARVAVLRSAATGKSRELALRLVDRDGRMRQYKTRIQAFAEDIPEASAPRDRLLIVSQDVTDLRESEERLLLAAHALEGMTQAILIISADGTVQTVNRAFTEITGNLRDDVIGQPEKALRNSLQPPEFYDDIYATVQRQGHWSGSTWSKRKNGAVYREWRSVRAVRNPAGTITHYVIAFYEERGNGGSHSGQEVVPSRKA